MSPLMMTPLDPAAVRRRLDEVGARSRLETEALEILTDACGRLERDELERESYARFCEHARASLLDVLEAMLARLSDEIAADARELDVGLRVRMHEAAARHDANGWE